MLHASGKDAFNARWPVQSCQVSEDLESHQVNNIMSAQQPARDRPIDIFMICNVS